MKTLADAVGRIQKTLNTPKLKAALARMDATLARADADFKEGDHPRDADGKFASKGAISGAAKHGVEAYKKALKPGATMKPQGLIKNMIKAGQYSEKDIWEAAKDTFDLSDDKKKWVKHSYYDLKHKSGDKNFPPIPKESTVGLKPEPAAAPEPEPVPTPAPVPEIAPVQAPAPASTSPTASAPEPVPTSKAPDNLSDKEKKNIIKNLPPNVGSMFTNVFKNYKKLTEENKQKVFEKFAEISNASGKTGDELENAVFSINEVKGGGLSVFVLNNAIKQWKSDLQAKMGAMPASYTPTTPSQSAAFKKISNTPHKQDRSVEYYENSEGKEVECVLNADTKNIPGDFYERVSSAYGGEVTHKRADSYEVDNAMHDYYYSTFSKLSTAEVSAISDYQGSDFTSINRALAGKEKPTPLTEKRIKNITAAIDKSFIPADTPVYRGIKASLEQITGFSDPAMAVGKVFEHKGFVSCTRSDAISERFSKGQNKGSTLLKFVVPAGANGVVMSGQTNYEKELLLQKNSTFLIEKVEMTKTGRPIVHVKYMGVSK
jgi:hypothetical protein